MFCNNCGKEIKDGAKFCPACGAEQGMNADVPKQCEDVGVSIQEAVQQPQTKVAMGPGFTKKSVDSGTDAEASGINAKISNARENASYTRVQTDNKAQLAMLQKRGEFPLWLKIVIPCAIVVVILIVLFAKGIIGSTGTDENTIVPDVVGEQYENAISIADDSDMLLVITGKENSDVVEQNNILSQDPKAKAEAPKGSALLGVVSGGEYIPVEVGVMPDIMFLLESDAIMQLDEAGIEYEINYIESDNILDGLVVGQPQSSGSSNNQAQIHVSTGSDTQREAIEKSGLYVEAPHSSTPDNSNNEGINSEDNGTAENEQANGDRELITVKGTIIDNMDVEAYMAKYNSYWEQYGNFVDSYGQERGAVGMVSYGIRFSEPVILPSGSTVSEAQAGLYSALGDGFTPDDVSSLIGTSLTMTGYLEKIQDYEELRKDSDEEGGGYTYSPNGEYRFEVVSILDVP